MKRKKFLSLFLAGVMVLALSACAKTPSSSTAQTSSTAAETSSAEINPYKEHVTLKWYMRRSEPANVDSVFAAINKITEEKINATVQMIFVEPADYDQKMQMVMGGGEAYDLAFTSNWANSYTNNVANKAYISINDYKNDQYMPDILKAIPDYVWKGITINDKVWAIPNYQTMVSQWGIEFNKELAEKYGLVDQINNIKTQDDLKNVLLKIKQNEPNVYPIRDFQTVNTDVDAKGNLLQSDIGLGLYFKYDNNTGKVVFTGDTELYQKNAKIAREWYEAGILPDDSTIMDDYTNFLTGKKLFALTGSTKPGYLEELKSTYGYEFIGIPTSQKVVTTTQTCSTLTGISVTSENPDRAVALYNLLYQDKDLYNTLVYGIKGQDYKWIDDTHVERIADQYAQSAWQVGNSFNAYFTGTQDNKMIQETLNDNASAQVDKLFGFNANLDKIETEYSAVQAVGSPYDTILTFGLNANVDTTLKEYHDKVFAAGAQKVIDEVQKQVDAFLAAKK